MTAPLLEARGLRRVFRVSRGLLRPATQVQAVDHVDLAIGRGETVSVVGESGCGKSTLGRMLLRLIEPSAGEIRFEGRDLMQHGRAELRAARRDMQMVFQDPFASLNPRLSVGTILAEPLRLHGIGTPADRRGRVEELLRTVGLSPAMAGRYPHEFSGGQRQRIGIARALALRPKLIVADEPVSALDVSVQAQVINLLKDLQEQFGMAYLVIAHDLTVVKLISDRVAVMYLGRIVETAPTRALYAMPRHPYTRALLSAIPIPDPSARRSGAVLEGELPSPAAPPSGCHFHTRCAHARARCRSEVPALDDQGDGHAVACHFHRELPAFSMPQAVRAVRADSAFARRLAALEARRAAARPVPAGTAG